VYKGAEIPIICVDRHCLPVNFPSSESSPHAVAVQPSGLDVGKHFSLCPFGLNFCWDKHSACPSTPKYRGGSAPNPLVKGLQSFPTNFFCTPIHANLVQLVGLPCGKHTSLCPPLLSVIVPKQSSCPSMLRYAGGIPVSAAFGVHAGRGLTNPVRLLNVSCYNLNFLIQLQKFSLKFFLFAM
jgi:hypothetical protein